MTPDEDLVALHSKDTELEKNLYALQENTRLLFHAVAQQINCRAPDDPLRRLIDRLLGTFGSPL